MKIFSRILSLLVLVSLGLLYTGCGGGGGSTDPVEKVQLAKLEANTWKINSVDLGGTTRTSDFTGLILTISGSFNSGSAKGPYNYTFTGTRPNPSPWPASGTWKFGSNVNTDLLRIDDDPDLAMNYSLTDTQLTITFTYSGAGFAGSRVNEVEGAWTFVFIKN